LSRHYLDHASTSTLRPEALAAMTEVLSGPPGDPGRVYESARTLRVGLEEARESVAGLAGVSASQVVFTSGATEAINAAVWGATRRRPGAAVLCAGVEHSAVRDASLRLAPLVDIEVDRAGRIHPAAVRAAGARAVAEHGSVALVHCQWANHEVGTVQAVEEVAALAQEMGALLHVDAAAGFGHLAGSLGQIGADLVSVSGHKLGAPAGIGALLVRRGLRLEALVVGGSQERARRGGLENVAAAAGFGAAAEVLAAGALETEAARARGQRAAVVAGVEGLDGIDLYGDPEHGAPHIVCLNVQGVEAEAVVIGLDRAGIAVHSGSACSSEALEPSPVLAAMGVDADRSLRISVGWSTTDADIVAFAQAFPEVVGQLRALARG
jgi:cysteine desulfurase